MKSATRVRVCEKCLETKRIAAKGMCAKCYDAGRHARQRELSGETSRGYTCQDCGATGISYAKSGYLPKRCAPCAAHREEAARRNRDQRRRDANPGLTKERDRMRRAANKARLIENGMPAGEKVCPTCNTTKPRTEFPVAMSKPDGRHTYCKACYRQQDRERRKVLREEYREYGRRHNARNPLAARLRGYQITVDDYLDLLNAQHRACAICEIAPDDPFALHVDHCHETGVVRGLLCVNCNTALGRLGEDPARLRRAAEYIETSRPT